jgi:hypothetical protein
MVCVCVCVMWCVWDSVVTMNERAYVRVNLLTRSQGQDILALRDWFDIAEIVSMRSYIRDLVLGLEKARLRRSSSSPGEVGVEARRNRKVGDGKISDNDDDDDDVIITSPP